MMGAMIKSAQCINLKEKKKLIKAILGRKECETIFFFRNETTRNIVLQKGICFLQKKTNHCIFFFFFFAFPAMLGLAPHFSQSRILNTCIRAAIATHSFAMYQPAFQKQGILKTNSYAVWTLCLVCGCFYTAFLIPVPETSLEHVNIVLIRKHRAGAS